MINTVRNLKVADNPSPNFYTQAAGLAPIAIVKQTVAEGRSRVCKQHIKLILPAAQPACLGLRPICPLFQKLFE